jgi:hypothetical protein
MQVSFFCGNGYLAREAFSHPGGWPTPPALYRPEVGLQSLQAALGVPGATGKKCTVRDLPKNLSL